MPHRSSNPDEQFAAVDEILSRWLAERNSLLSKYTEIAVATDTSIGSNQIELGQKALGELIVDYISAGHFEVFHELINEAELFNDGGRKLAASIIPQISDTTEVILAYEEKYGAGQEYPDTLERDLSALGEILENRFVLEDQLIAGLHTRHRFKLRRSGALPA